MWGLLWEFRDTNLEAEGPSHISGSRGVTPTFYKNKKICANRNAYKNAYQIIVLMKNFPKINLV
jgi:hypothetical protein